MESPVPFRFRSARPRAILALAIGLFASCASPTGPGDPFTVDATVEFLNLEGGCWTLLSVDSVRYLPTNLAETYRQDGLAVEVRLEIAENQGSVCQVGEIVEILDIRLRLGPQTP